LAKDKNRENILKRNVLKRKWLQVGVPLLAAGILTLGAAPFAGASGKVLTSGQANTVSNGYVSKVKTDASLHAKLPASIKAKGSILIGAQLLGPPLSYLSKSGKQMGFEVNLADAVGKVLGVKIKWLQLPQWSSIVPAVEDGRVNMSITYMNDTVPREQLINFIDYLVDGIAIGVKTGNPENITGPSGLCGKNVSDMAGTTDQIYLQSLNATGGVCASTPITEVVAQSTDQALVNVTTGRADAVLSDNISAVVMMSAASGTTEVGPVIEPSPYGMGFAKNSQPLMRAVQGAMNKLMAGGKNSVYQKIFTAWGQQSAEIPKPLINGCKTVYKAVC
jgi:polar amino acid transport system substrate-binding protein